MFQDVEQLIDRLRDAVRRVLTRSDGPLALGIVLGLTALLEVALYKSEVGGPEVAMIFNLAATLPIALARQRLILATSLTTFASFMLLVGIETLTISAVLAELLLVYLVASQRHRWVSVLFVMPFLFNAVVAVGGNDQYRYLGVILLVLVVAAQVLGDTEQRRGEALAERDATRLAMAETLREQAVIEERTRIAREMHDVVAHHVSMIAVQAETARLTTPDLPKEGQERLEAIGDTARDALTEMRRLLGILRTNGDGTAERAPQPGLDRLEDLLEAARTAGTHVRLILTGRVSQVAPGVDLSAYRIVQEALTNARQHAPGADVDVELSYLPDKLQLRVRDRGPGGTPDGDGHGLLGMRERATMVGGTLRAGPADGGGFEVEAELPLQEARA